MSVPDVCVVTTLFRTAEFVPSLIDRLEATFADCGMSWSAVMVDDGCPDQSGLAVRQTAHPHVTLIEMARNSGQHVAMSAGIAAAGGRVVVVLDSDLQDRPEDIPALIAGIDDRSGIVAAGRRGVYGSMADHVTGRAFRSVRWIASGGAIPRDAGMFVAGSEEVMKRIGGYGAGSVHFLSKAAVLGVPIETIPIKREPRPSGLGSYTAAMRIRVALRALAALIPGRGPRVDLTSRGGDPLEASHHMSKDQDVD